ncbi:MAG: acyltransferase [Clostridia bacterium]|nr:acyltransferase [Clostridia bacterium]
MKPYRPSARHIPELNGLRVLLVFIVSWYHIWQQSWLTPYIGSYSLDYLVRSGYVPVDGTILLSGFLLFLPHARSMLLGEPVPSVRVFYQRRVMRIVPSYYFTTLLMLFAVAIPYGLYYGNSAGMWRDVLMHLTFTQTFNAATYISTPIGVASWTIAIEMQAYLLFPLLAKAARKNPLATFAAMAAAALGFRCWCLWDLSDYNMVVNQLINFMDVYAAGMGASLIYVKLTTLYPEEKRRQRLWQAAATLLAAAAVYGLIQALRAQAGSVNTSGIQSGQMIRRPVFAALLAILAVSLPFAARPVRFLMGNRLMGFLALISMNYYLMHQNIAVHLKRVGFPPSVSATPNFDREVPWMYQYTWLCFGLSVLTAFLMTFLVEKPGAWLLGKAFARLNGIFDRRRAARMAACEKNAPVSSDERPVILCGTDEERKS